MTKRTKLSREEIDAKLRAITAAGVPYTQAVAAFAKESGLNLGSLKSRRYILSARDGTVAQPAKGRRTKAKPPPEPRAIVVHEDTSVAGLLRQLLLSMQHEGVTRIEVDADGSFRMTKGGRL